MSVWWGIFFKLLPIWKLLPGQKREWNVITSNITSQWWSEGKNNRGKRWALHNQKSAFPFPLKNKRRNAKGPNEGLHTSFTFAWIPTVAARPMGSWYFVITGHKYFELWERRQNMDSLKLIITALNCGHHRGEKQYCLCAIRIPFALFQKSWRLDLGWISEEWKCWVSPDWNETAITGRHHFQYFKDACNKPRSHSDILFKKKKKKKKRAGIENNQAEHSQLATISYRHPWWPPEVRLWQSPS